MRGGVMAAAAAAAARKSGCLRSASWIALLALLLRTVTVVYGENRAHCPTLMEKCALDGERMVLGSLTSDNTSQTLRCTSGTIGTFIWYRTQNSTNEGRPIDTADTDKYVLGGVNDERLTVKNVSVTDEGIYYCLVNGIEATTNTCLLAYVPAEFETCPGGLSTARRGCDRREMLQATTDSSQVQFNVSVIHREVSNSCYNQTISRITFTREVASGPSSVTITCNEDECMKEGDERFTVMMQSGYEDIAIKLVNQTEDDSGNYSVRAVVQEAGSTIMFCLYKNFTLAVTVPTTQPPTTTEGSTGSGDPSGSGLSTEVLAAIVVVFVVLFIPLVVLIIAVVLLCSLTCYKRQQEAKKSLYEDADQAMRKNGSSIRKLLGSSQPPDAVSMRSHNEAEGVGELNPNFNSEDTFTV